MKENYNFSHLTFVVILFLSFLSYTSCDSESIHKDQPYLYGPTINFIWPINEIDYDTLDLTHAFILPAVFKNNSPDTIYLNTWEYKGSQSLLLPEAQTFYNYIGDSLFIVGNSINCFRKNNLPFRPLLPFDSLLIYTEIEYGRHSDAVQFLYNYYHQRSDPKGDLNMVDSFFIIRYLLKDGKYPISRLKID